MKLNRKLLLKSLFYRLRLTTLNHSAHNCALKNQVPTVCLAIILNFKHRECLAKVYKQILTQPQGYNVYSEISSILLPLQVQEIRLSLLVKINLVFGGYFKHSKQLLTQK